MESALSSESISQMVKIITYQLMKDDTSICDEKLKHLLKQCGLPPTYINEKCGELLDF